MDFEQITYAVSGTIVVITLNRPERRNALSGKLPREPNAALLEAGEHNAVHRVVLRGAGPHFCAAADLTELSRAFSDPAGSTLRSDNALADCFSEHLYPTGDPIRSDDALVAAARTIAAGRRSTTTSGG